MTCPDDDAIDRFTSGGANEGEAHDIREHLPECATCRRLVSALVKESVASEPVEASESGGGPLLRGTQVSRYIIIDFIGAGAMGMVYAAYDPQLDRKVALKLLHPDSAARSDQAPLRARMLREAQAMARLVHPNVVAIHDAGVIGDQIHIAMDLVEGRSVRAWLAERPRAWREIVDVYLQAGRGLAAAHRAGLVHRDFKPDNILVGGDGRALVTDFGMASLGAAEGVAATAESYGAAPLQLTQTGMMMGTPAYMAPEQLTATRVDARADIYAFAVSAWEGLHGAHPFPNDDFPTLRAAVLAGRIREPARSSVPARIRRALATALRPDPADRPASVEPLLDALSANPRRKILVATVIVAAAIAVALVAFAARAALLSRAQAREAEARGALASRLGQEVKEMELGLRAERLLPLHDMEPGEARVRTRLAAMHAMLDGSSADAVVHDAIGRGLVALGDHAEARPELEAALAGGANDPELHWALGYTMLRLHDRALDEARRMGGPTWVAKRKAALDAEFLPGARQHLELAHGTTLAPPDLLEALLAYQAGDLDGALAKARAAASASPIYYEAQALAGEILVDESRVANDHQDTAGADKLLDDGIAALELAAQSGRSDAAIYDDIAGAWLRRLELRRYEAFERRRPAYDAGLAASARSIAASPQRSRGYTRRAQISSLAAYNGSPMPAGFQAENDTACIEAAGSAVARDPHDAIALDTLGNCWSDRASYVVEAVSDISAECDHSVQAFAAAQAASPGFPWAASDLCFVDVLIETDRVFVGLNPMAAAAAAISACELAIRLDPAYANPQQNLVWAFAALAAGQVTSGRWDAEAERRARAARLAANGLPDGTPLTSSANLTILRTAKLEFAAAAGSDPRPAIDELERNLVEVASLTPPGSEGGELELMTLEARATIAVVRAETGSGAVDRHALDRCLALQPQRFACRLLEVRADWVAGDVAAAQARAAKLTIDFPRSGRSFAMLAESILRNGAKEHIERVEAGLRAADEAIARAPDLGEAHAVRGRLLTLVAHDPAGAGRALASMDLAVALNPLLAARVAVDRRAMVDLAVADSR